MKPPIIQRDTLLRTEPCATCTANHQLLRQKKISGFTIIELIVTIVIIGILTAAGAPMFSQFIAGQRIKTASFDIMSSLTLARSEALKRNANVTVTPVTTSQWESGWSVTSGGTTINQQSALKGMTITCKNGTTTTTCPSVGLTYGANGRLTASVPSFELGSTSSTSKRCISIDLSGRPNSKIGAC